MVCFEMLESFDHLGGGESGTRSVLDEDIRCVEELVDEQEVEQIEEMFLNFQSEPSLTPSSSISWGMDSPPTGGGVNATPISSSSSASDSRTSHTSSQSHARNETNEVWLCCGRSFTKKGDLNRHNRCHVKPFRCLHSDCESDNAVFSFKKDLVRHQDSRHSDLRYFCPISGCPSAAGGNFGGFTREDNLGRHIKAQHSGLKVRGKQTSDDGAKVKPAALERKHA